MGKLRVEEVKKDVDDATSAFVDDDKILLETKVSNLFSKGNKRLI